MKTSITELQSRNRTRYDNKHNIIQNGEDNLYPQRMELINNASSTAKAANDIAAKFVKGDGFDLAPDLLKKVVGITEIYKLTVNKLLKKVANDAALHRGVFLHVNYNAAFEITGISLLPYKYCRLKQVDSYGNISKVVYYDNWDKSKKKQIRKEDFVLFDLYNSNKELIQYQVDAAGGFQKWYGQVFYYNFDDVGYYPLSSIDVVQDDADTESQIQVYKNQDLRSGFFSKYLLKHAYFDDETDKEDFLNNLRKFAGAENNTPFMVVEDEGADDGTLKQSTLQLEKIDQNINDKIWEHYEKSCSNNIRRSVYNIPPVMIDYIEGQLGNTSGESLMQARNFMNEQMRYMRSDIEEIFTQLFSNFTDETLRVPFKIKLL